MIIFDFSIRLEIFIIAYLLTQAVYGFDHYHDAHNDGVNNTSRVEYVQRNKKIYPYRLGIFVGLFLVLLFYFGNALAIFMGISILALGLSYSLWCKNITKSIVGFKNIYVASSISLGIVFTSSFYQNNLPIGILFFTIYTTLSYFMNCSLCDMKDIESDKKQGLKTLPLVLGKQRFFLFIIAINTLIVSLLVILVYIQVIPFYFISLVGFNILWFFMIRMGMKPNIDYHLFTTKIMDSMEIFSFLFLFIGKTIMTMFVL